MNIMEISGTDSNGNKIFAIIEQVMADGEEVYCVASNYYYTLQEAVNMAMDAVEVIISGNAVILSPDQPIEGFLASQLSDILEDF